MMNGSTHGEVAGSPVEGTEDVLGSQGRNSRERTAFGRLIEMLLEEKGRAIGRQVSLNEICQRADVDVSNVWRSMYSARREGRPPSPSILRALSAHLPISYTELLRRSGHGDVAEAIESTEKLEERIEIDPTLAPDIKAQLKSYLMFLRRMARIPRLA